MKTHVASVCFKCFICFRVMLQVFQMNVAKVDRDVAYVAMVVHICCKGLFLMFHRTYVANVFICMLHMFHTYVTSVLSGYWVCL
jgi:hypothetical protein